MSLQGGRNEFRILVPKQMLSWSLPFLSRLINTPSAHLAFAFAEPKRTFFDSYFSRPTSRSSIHFTLW